MPNWPVEPASGHVWLYLFYNIWFKDPTEYEAAVATFGSSSISRSPGYMRDALGIAENAVGWDGADDTWIQFVNPPYAVLYNMDGTWQSPRTIKGAHAYVYPSNNTNGDPYWWPPDAYTFDYEQDWIDVPGHTSVPIWGEGPPIAWVWVGNLLMAGGVTVDTPTALDNIRPRRFFTGFEIQNGGQDAPQTSPEGDDGTVWSEVYTRAASRTPDGIGFCCVDQINSRQTTEYGTLVNGENSWERFYIKILKYPSGSIRLWTAVDDGAGESRVILESDGKLNGEVRDNFGGVTSDLDPAGLILPLNEWLRVDIYVLYTPTVTGCDVSVTVEIKGVPQSSWSGTVNLGFGSQQVLHASSVLGPISTTGLGWLAHFDDWSNMDPGDPSIPGDVTFRNTADYFMGHHVQRNRARSLAENTNWTGDYRTALQNPTANPVTNLVSSTSGARLAVNTEADGTNLLEFVRQYGALAIKAMVCLSKGTASTTDKLGSILGSSGEDSKTISMGTTREGYSSIRNIASGATMPPSISVYEPSQALLIKSTDANQNNVSFLELEAQYMGSYGPEDEYDPDGFPGITDLIGYHNAPYYASYLGRNTVPPVNTVAVATGTYTGNGTFQDITITLPGIHFLYIRNVSTGNKVWWFSPMLGPHINTVDDDIIPAVALDINIDENGDTVIKLVGSNAASNDNGVTYQYVAFSDVMSRILLNHCWKFESGANVVPLFDSNFTPEFSLFQLENVKNNSAAINMWFKGPGMASTSAKKIDSTPNANGMTFGTGQITAGTALSSSISGAVGTFWRQTDGNDVNSNIIYIGQYTGNGAVGTRDVSVTLNSRRPLFALVGPVTGSGDVYARDPSHTSNNSQEASGSANSTTAITGGGVDIIQVGTTLNQNGVVYSVFIIPSCTDDAGNGGWGVDGVCGLAEPGWNGPGTPDAPDWMLTPPDIPADVSIIGSGGLVISGNPTKLLLENVSGLYTLVPNQRHDHLQDSQVGQTEVDVPIPNPYGKTGFIGG